MKSPCQKTEFFSWLDLAAILFFFLPIWGSHPRKNDGDFAENQSVYRSGQFKKIDAVGGRGHG